MVIYCVEEQEKGSKYSVLRYGIILWKGTGECIKLLSNEIWHYSVERDRRLYQIIVYSYMALYSERDRRKYQNIVY
jgi:hypothetical protein